MSAQIKTILVVGGTGGIGEAFARCFHAMGKKLIVTGRRQQQLADLSKELEGLETFELDNTDFEALPMNVATLLRHYPDISTVWVNRGIQEKYSFKEQPSTTDNIFKEIETNVIAPTRWARYFVPHLIAESVSTVNSQLECRP